MKTLQKIGFAVVLLTLCAGLLSCSGDEKETPNYDALVAEKIIEGKALLSRGQTTAAEKLFAEASKLAPKNGEARFGVILSNTLSLVDFGASLVSMTLQLKMSAAADDQPTRAEFLFSELYRLLEIFVTRMAFLREQSTLLLKNDPGFEFTIDYLPLIVFLKPAVNLSGTYSRREATAMLASYEAAESMFLFISSQQFTVDVFEILYELEALIDMWGRNDEPAGFDEIADLFIRVLDANPNFLKMREGGDQNFIDAGARLVAALDHLLDAIELYRTDKGSAELDWVLEHEKTDDGDQLRFGGIIASGAEEFQENSAPYPPDSGIDPFEYSDLYIPLGPQPEEALTAFAENMRGEDRRVNLKNDLVPLLIRLVYIVAQLVDLGELVGSDSLGEFEPYLKNPEMLENVVGALVPNFCELDLHAFFANPIGLRELLPAIDESGLGIDWECPGGVTPPDIGGGCRPQVTWQDPTFNGLLWLDIYPLGITGSTDAEGFEPADDDAIDALIDWLLDLVGSFL